MGLAVTHKILEHHGVKIFVESVLSQGTEFTLESRRQRLAGRPRTHRLRSTAKPEAQVMIVTSTYSP